MNDPADLHAQLAQRLFGWTWREERRGWKDPTENDNESLSALPAYTTDPAATAQVWQWLERRGAPLDLVHFEYQAMEEEGLCCTLQCGRGDVEGYGTTWPEALCRAALALAEALQEGT